MKNRVKVNTEVYTTAETISFSLLEGLSLSRSYSPRSIKTNSFTIFNEVSFLLLLQLRVTTEVQ